MQGYRKDAEQLANRKSDLDKQLDIMQMKYKVRSSWIHTHTSTIVHLLICMYVCMYVCVYVLVGTNGRVFSSEKSSSRRAIR